MTKFESLLIKAGNPELIMEFIKEFPDKADDDEFRREVVAFWKRAEVSVINALYVPEGILEMRLAEFLNMFGQSNNHLANTLCKESMASKNGQIEKVQDLLKYSKKELKQFKGIGEKQLSQLQEALAYVNLTLVD